MSISIPDNPGLLQADKPSKMLSEKPEITAYNGIVEMTSDRLVLNNFVCCQVVPCFFANRY